jgi:hypothetical protein
LLTGDLAALAHERTTMAKPSEHFILPELVAQEQTGPFVRQGDDPWLTVVHWTLLALIEGWVQTAVTDAMVLQGLEMGPPRAHGDMYTLLGWTQVSEAPTWIPTAGREVEHVPLPGEPWVPSGNTWSSRAPVAGVPEHTLLVHDSFVEVPRLEEQVASFLPTVDVVHWDAAMRLPELGGHQAVVLETTERLVLSRFVDPAVNAPLRGVRDHLRDMANG